MSEVVIKIDDVYKQYRLGAIGGRTLQEDLQSFIARKFHKEDPNLRIGQEDMATRRGERFNALSGVSFEVYKGDTLGIIGHNGAGKSTLLKLLSRVTAPTSGTISYNGRISSMLEVGTGFHQELTGRENAYLNGSILGMTKTEIDRKFDEIVEFAEMQQFIDTPVKRYSSGMYVKLAFAVSAHLDADILVMDEVLAVGDMKFQQKCLGKMSNVADSEGKTVLYVSHNMNTIRQLCNRCIVLDRGKLIFDGDTESAIEMYMSVNDHPLSNNIDVSSLKRESRANQTVLIDKIRILNNEKCLVDRTEPIDFEIDFRCTKPEKNVFLRATVKTPADVAIGMTHSEEPMDFNTGIITKRFSLKLDTLVNGKYSINLVLFNVNDFGAQRFIDIVPGAFGFEKFFSSEYYNNIDWEQRWWGNNCFEKIKEIN